MNISQRRKAILQVVKQKRQKGSHLTMLLHYCFVSSPDINCSVIMRRQI